MARILITSGPTRQYLDPVRYLTNGSSGRMGCALAVAALESGHEVVIISGPVDLKYPAAALVHDVVSTEQMLAAAIEAFGQCDGVLGVAAPCDYRPQRIADQKIAKTGEPLVMHLVETSDVIATLGAAKEGRWVVGFALETGDHQARAMRKLKKKKCDLIVLNEPTAVDAEENRVEVLDDSGDVVLHAAGDKSQVARDIFQLIQQRLIRNS